MPPKQATRPAYRVSGRVYSTDSEAIGVDDVTVYIQAQAANLAEIYGKASQELKRIVLPVGGDGAASYTAVKVRKMQEQLDALKVELDRVVAKEMATSTRRVYDRARDVASTDMKGLGLIDSELPLGGQVHTRLVGMLADTATLDLLDANNQLLGSGEKYIRASQLARAHDTLVTKDIAVGATIGEAQTSTIARVAASLREKVAVGGLIQINGGDGKVRSYKPETYASLIVRTRLREAQTQSTINAAKEAQMELVQVSVHENACPVCQKYQGKVYSISSSNGDFPDLEVHPPYHPHCGHTLHPLTAGHLKDVGQYEQLREFSNKPNATLDGVDAYSGLFPEPKDEPKKAPAAKREKKKPVPMSELMSDPRVASVGFVQYPQKVLKKNFDNFVGLDADFTSRRGKNGLPRQFTNKAVIERKHRVATELSKRSGIPYEECSQMIHHWAVSSNDNNFTSLHAQQRAAKLFGGENTAWQKSKMDRNFGVRRKNAEAGMLTEAGGYHQHVFEAKVTVNANGDLVSHLKPGIPYKDIDEATDAFLTAMYEHTQETFKADGITHIQYYRGIQDDIATDVARQARHMQGLGKKNPEVAIYENTLHSASLIHKEVANGFSHGPILQASVPVEKVLSTARTGYGCSDEWEAVIIANKEDIFNVTFKD